MKKFSLTYVYAALIFGALSLTLPAMAQPKTDRGAQADSLSGPQRSLPGTKELVCKEAWDETKCSRLKARFEEIQTYRRAQRAKLNLLKSRHQELEERKHKAKTLPEIQALEVEAQKLLTERDALKIENDAFNEKIKLELRREALLEKESKIKASELGNALAPALNNAAPTAPLLP